MNIQKTNPHGKRYVEICETFRKRHDVEPGCLTWDELYKIDKLLAAGMAHHLREAWRTQP